VQTLLSFLSERITELASWDDRIAQAQAQL
jgi:hypothetical protein